MELLGQILLQRDHRLGMGCFKGGGTIPCCRLRTERGQLLRWKENTMIQ